MQQMGGGVVALGVDPRAFGHRGRDGAALARRPLLHLDAVDDEALDGFLGVEHPGAAAVPADLAGVPDLTAGLSEEWRRLEHDLAGFTGARADPRARPHR